MAFTVNDRYFRLPKGKWMPRLINEYQRTHPKATFDDFVKHLIENEEAVELKEHPGFSVSVRWRTGEDDR